MKTQRHNSGTASEKNAEALAAFHSFLSAIEAPPAEAYAFLKPHLKPRSVKKKTVFWPAGMPSRHVWFVASGLVRGYYTQPDGTETTGWLAEAGELVCTPAGLFTGATCDDCLATIQDSHLVEIPYNVLQNECAQFGYFCRLVRSLLQHALVKQDERLRLLRISNAQERLNRFANSSPDLYMSTPACVLASYLGISKASMNRMLPVSGRAVRLDLDSVQRQSA